jgi:hypothetical protein
MDATVFPCLPPFLEGSDVVSGLRSRRAVRHRKRVWAQKWVNDLLCFYTWLEMGSPDKESDYIPRGGFSDHPLVRTRAEELRREVQQFGCPGVDKVPLARGRKELSRAISSFKFHDYFQRSSPSATEFLPTAIPVNTDRIALPERAGTVDPGMHLPPERRRVFRDLARLKLPEAEWGTLPRPCHRVPKSQETKLARNLLTSEMCVLIAEEDLPRTSWGAILSGGLFAVVKDSEQDRLIFDRRVENATVRKLKWLSLPAGACFTNMWLERGESLRGSGDDLQNFYYLLAIPENWHKHNILGEAVDPQLVAEFLPHADPTKKFRLALRVLGMGDCNACDLAQATHEHILMEAGLLGDNRKLEYGKAAPRDSIWEGCYLDDLLITLRYLRGRRGGPPSSPDLEQARAAEAAYAEAGLPRALHKSFRGLTSFKAWGAEIEGNRGTAGPPLATRRELWQITFEMVQLGYSTKRMLEKLLGFYASCFTYRREFFSVLHHIYKWLASCREHVWYRLPSTVLDELRAAALHLPLCAHHMRYEVSDLVISTDATPTRAGSCGSRVPRKLARALLRVAEQKGFYARLDAGPQEPAPEGGPVGDVSDLSRALKWHVRSSFEFRNVHHINLQEARAWKHEVKQLSMDEKKPFGTVHIFLCDSQVCVGALSRGRSSSYRLNGIIRGALGYQVLAGMCIKIIWVDTHSNLADCPSRRGVLPPPEPLPAWAADYFENFERFQFGVDVFSIFGDLWEAGAWWNLGIVSWGGGAEYVDMDSLEIMLVEQVQSGSVSFVLLDPACVGWCRRERRAQLWSVACKLAVRCHFLGVPFFLKYPRRSDLWKTTLAQYLRSLPDVKNFKLDTGIAWDREGTCGTGPLTVCSNAPWADGLVDSQATDNMYHADLIDSQASLSHLSLFSRMLARISARALLS